MRQQAQRNRRNDVGGSNSVLTLGGRVDDIDVLWAVHDDAFNCRAQQDTLAGTHDVFRHPFRNPHVPVARIHELLDQALDFGFAIRQRLARHAPDRQPLASLRNPVGG